MRRARQTAEKIEGSAHRTGSLPTVVGNRTLAPPRERSRERGTDAVDATRKPWQGTARPASGTRIATRVAAIPMARRTDRGPESASGPHRLKRRPRSTSDSAVQDGASAFKLLYDLGCAFAARLELDELIPLVITKARETLAAEGAAVLLLDAERGELYFPYVAEEDADVAGSLARLRFPASAGIA